MTKTIIKQTISLIHLIIAKSMADSRKMAKVLLTYMLEQHWTESRKNNEDAIGIRKTVMCGGSIST